jgi:hypothetical protein
MKNKLFLEILIRENGKERYVDARKFFDYMLKEYSKISYSNKLAEPYNTRVDKFYNNIPQHVIDAWTKAYPNVDIVQECAKSRAWLFSNTSKAKKDFMKFTNNWLSKAMQNGGQIPVQLDYKIEKQIDKQKEYMKQNEESAAPQDWIKDLLKKTKEKMNK